MQNSLQIVLSIIIGTVAGVLSNVIATWVQPTANRFPKTVISIFIGLTACFIAIELLPQISSDKKIASRFGIIIDSKTKAPIPGATVILEHAGTPQVKYTDAEGVYRFDLEQNQEKMQINIKVSASGYYFYERNIEINGSIPQIDEIRLTRIPTEETAEAPTPMTATAVIPTTPLASSTPEPTYTSTAEPPPTSTKAPTKEPTQPPPPTPIPVPTADPRTLFSDNFENGSNPNWSIERGTWNMVDRRFKVTQFDSGYAELRIGDDSWDDYSVSLNTCCFIHDWGSGNDEVLRIAIRAQDPENYIWFDISSFVIKYGTRVNGVEQEIAAKGSGVNGPVIGNEVTIRIKVQGETYEVYINDKQFGVFADSSRSRGGVFIIARAGYRQDIWIDNVKATSLKQ